MKKLIILLAISYLVFGNLFCAIESHNNPDKYECLVHQELDLRGACK